MPKTLQPVQDLTPRLAAVQRAVEDDESSLRDNRELRRRLVVQAADEGMPHRAIGRALGGKGTGLVSKILAKPDPDEDES
jgi:hypothetical protein